MPDPVEVQVGLDFCRAVPRCANVRLNGGTSYGNKAAAEHYYPEPLDPDEAHARWHNRYLTNGAFLLACCIEGIRVEPIENCAPNAWVGIAPMKHWPPAVRARMRGIYMPEYVGPVTEETALYRHFDANGRLLYVGISLSAVGRLAQHRHTATWHRDIASMTTEWFGSRAEALAAEKAAIRHEFPAHNKQGRVAA